MAVNLTGQSYSYFILRYECGLHPHHYSLAFYQFNHRFAKDRTIGQIRSAEFMSEYFRPPLNFTFIAFNDRLYVNQLTPPPTSIDNRKTTNIEEIEEIEGTTASSSPSFPFSPSRYATCIEVRVNGELSVSVNYERAPPLKFLVL